MILQFFALMIIMAVVWYLGYHRGKTIKERDLKKNDNVKIIDVLTFNACSNMKRIVSLVKSVAGIGGSCGGEDGLDFELGEGNRGFSDRKHIGDKHFICHGGRVF